MTRPLIPSDISRCRGEAAEHACQTCARRAQIAIDDSSRYYPYMSAAPIRGTCVYRIEIKEAA